MIQDHLVKQTFVWTWPGMMIVNQGLRGSRTQVPESVAMDGGRPEQTTEKTQHTKHKGVWILEEKEFEMAEILAQAHTEKMIAASQRALAPEIHEAFDGKHCVECADDIAKERLAMGRVRCTDCQAAQERMKKRYKH